MGSSSGETDGLFQSRQGKLLSLSTKAYVIVASALLCLSNLMLPVENGLPPFHIGPAPITLPVIAAGLAAVVLALQPRTRFLRTLHMPYCVLWSALLVYFLAASCLQGEFLVSLLSVGMMSMAFLINYMVIVCLFRLGGRDLFAKVLCVVAACATVPGIYEFVTGSRLPVYAEINTLYWLSRNMSSGLRGSTYDWRVTGTLGNPIVYSAAMMLCMPFACELKSKLSRRVLCGLLLFAAFSTLSRAAFLFAGSLLVGYVAIEKKKSVRVLLAVILLAGVVLSGSDVVYDNTLTSRWQSRFHEETEAGDQGGVPARLSLIQTTVDACTADGPLGFLLGKGFLSSRQIGLAFSDVLETIDNAYVTILYENGLVGLIGYVALYGWLLYRSRSLAFHSYHWYSVLGFMLAGMSFVTYGFGTISFVAVASMAIITTSRPCAKPSAADEPHAE